MPDEIDDPGVYPKDAIDKLVAGASTGEDMFEDDDLAHANLGKELHEGLKAVNIETPPPVDVEEDIPAPVDFTPIELDIHQGPPTEVYELQEFAANNEEVNDVPLPDVNPDAHDYKPKSYLVLKDFSESDLGWGMVLYCPGAINFTPANAEIVGTWTKAPNGQVWVGINMPMDAMNDKSTQMFLRIAKEREAERISQGTHKKASGGPSPKRIPKPTPVPTPAAPDPMDALRALMGGL